MKPRKVAVHITLTVDPAAWENTYGQFSPADVRDYVLGYIQGSAASDEGCILEATLRVDQ